MRKSVVVLFLILVISLITLQAASKRSRTADPSIQIPGVAINAMQKIDPERIRAHVRFLSDDLLEGRGTGQRGGDIAAEYIATQFALYGLKPAGQRHLHAKSSDGGHHAAARDYVCISSRQRWGQRSEASRPIRGLRSDPAAA